MKKSTLISTIAMAFLMLISITINAQEFPKLDKSPMDASSFPSDYKEPNKLIKIIYSRPELRGRSVEELVPKGEVWRTGANEAAELTLYVPMKFGEVEIGAGTYTLYVISGDNEWTVIISKDLNVWGSYFYSEGNDIARLTVETSINKDSLEAFSIVFGKSEKGGINMHLGWGNTRAIVPFKYE